MDGNTMWHKNNFFLKRFGVVNLCCIMGLDSGFTISTISSYMGDYFKTFREQIVNKLKEKGLKQIDLFVAAV